MSEFRTRVEAVAKDLEAAIWEGVPSPESGPWVLWPGTDLLGYVDFVRKIEVRVLYVDVALELICVARDGVMHFFEARPGALAEVLPSATPWDDELDSELDDESDWEGDSADDSERVGSPLESLTPEMHHLARRIANDGRYFPYTVGPVIVAELASALDDSEQALVGAMASRIFSREVWAVSSRQRNDLSIFLRGSPVAECHPRSPIERILDCQEIVFGVQRKIGALGHVLTKQPVGVLIRAALPWTV